MGITTRGQSELLLIVRNYIIRQQEFQSGHFQRARRNEQRGYFLFFNLQMLSATLLLNLGSLITEFPVDLDISISIDPSS